MVRETTEFAKMNSDRMGRTIPTSGKLDPDTMELFLASSGVNDVVRMLDGSRENLRFLGALTARLVELGGQMPHDGDPDDGHAYADVMRLQRRRLELDPSARHDLALHPRTYGRPSKQLTTESDDWVVPMVEAEIERMSADDLALLRQHIIMRVGRQHDIHPGFRPLLLRLSTDDRTLASLASVEQGQVGPASQGKSYLLAAVAGPFIDVVMSDADDGIELEAAAWTFAQRRIGKASASATSQHLIQTVREVSSLLALLDTSRTLAARQSQAQTHAGLATRSAVAEFILTNLLILGAKTEASLERGQLEIGSFVRRDFVGRANVEISKATLEIWATTRTPRRLLLDLVLTTLLADCNRHDLPPMPMISENDVTEPLLRHLAMTEQQTLGMMTVQAINSGWYLGDWAGAA